MEARGGAPPEVCLLHASCDEQPQPSYRDSRYRDNRIEALRKALNP